MRIVVLDDVALDDDHFELLNSLGDLTVYHGTPSGREEILTRGQGAEVIISGWTNYPEGIFKELPQLKMISLWATGTDYVNMVEAGQAGVIVTNVPGYAGNAVAELAFGLMLAVLRKIPQAHQEVRATGAYNWQLFEGRELAGKTLGILGTGAIGVKVARIAQGFDMNVIAYDVRKREDLEAEGLMKYVAFDEIFANSNIISVHMPLIAETAGIITYDELAKMPQNGVLINTARAGLVDQTALIKCLKNGILAGAGLDDVDLESASAVELLSMDQVVLTPHMGFYTKEAIRVKTQICLENVMNYIRQSH